MAIDMDKMAKERAEKKSEGGYWKPENGESVVYVAPPCRADDKWEPTCGTFYIEVDTHFRVGGSITHVCGRSAILKHPIVMGILKEKGIKPSGKCPTCERQVSGTMSAKAMADTKKQTSFLFGIIPQRKRPGSTGPWSELAHDFKIYEAKKTVWGGIIDQLQEFGDISDPKKPVFVKITRTGQGLSTEYAVMVDGLSVTKPAPLPPAQLQALREAQVPEGRGDLFAEVARKVRPDAEIEAALNGIAVEDDTSAGGAAPKEGR